MIDFLIEPWLLGDWMWRGTLTGLLVALVCAPLGVLLYLRRMSMLSDALAHVALPGLIGAFLLTGTLSPGAMLIGAGIAGLLASAAIGGLSRVRKVRPDAAIGIVFTAFFALGVIGVSSFAREVHLDADCVLYGDILGVSGSTIWMLTIVCPLVWGAVLLGRRWLSLSSFDAGYAFTIGVPIAWLHYLLMGGVSMATVASFEAVGAILVIAFFSIPAATGHTLARTFSGMLVIALVHSIVSVLTGMYVAIGLDISASGAIVVVQGVLYVVALGSVWLRERPLKRAGRDDSLGGKLPGLFRIVGLTRKGL